MLGVSFLSQCSNPYRISCFKFSTNFLLKSKNARESKVMNKFLAPSKNKKKKFYVLPYFDRGSQGFDYVSNHKNSLKNDRRLAALNKIFMKNITDLLSTGELSQEVTGRGIQISKVNVTPTFHQVNVHWLANGNDSDLETEKLLSEIAPKLRHELSQLRVMGSVPKIEFVKDSTYLKYLIVENILKDADFGDDFEPTPLANDWKSDNAIQPPQSSDVESDNKSQESATDDVDEPLPVMRMDTFGLQHECIMKKVIMSVQKAKAAHRRDQSINLSSSDTAESSETADILSSRARKKLFREFLLKKKLEWKKSLSKEKKYQPDSFILEQQVESKFFNEFLQDDDDYDNFDEFDRNSNYFEDDYPKN